ncbi:MAG: hypothetical protein AMS22_10395 [Thiotrichales bacterium SG8_50]|jgi:isoquinoline 1-oxidoreductase beta subunit|nr:MAG: hypothetical protein AMS22_10395 [Thiotrichales bacterium SG8_50]
MSVSRRTFLKAAGASSAVLSLGFTLPSCTRDSGHATTADSGFRPNIWLEIATSGLVTIWVAEAEMGQGVYTSLPMLVAEELDTPLSTVRVLHAPTDPAYGTQSTGGSTSIRNSWKPLREAGAAARAMLVDAAAKHWGVKPAACHTDGGRVLHDASGRKLGYGDLTTLAAKEPVPAVVTLKSPNEFKILGRPFRRLDSPEKVDGSAKFCTDIVLPGLVYASVAHPPVFGSPVGNFKADDAKRVKGVREVFAIESGVAVVADNSWSAMRGARAVRFTGTGGGSLKTSHSIRDDLRSAVKREGVVTLESGNVASASSAAARTIEAEYHLPFQAHATMEPMGCTAVVKDGRCEVWASTQSPTEAKNVATRYVSGTAARLWRQASEKLLGQDTGNVVVHTTLLGGGFGRRLKQDYVAEVVQISAKVGKPVRLLWSREEDMQHDFYRSVSFHSLRAGLDATGMPVFWHHRSAGPSISKSASQNMPYAIANMRSEIHEVATPVPTGPWRSVGHSYHGFVMESFLDELAAAGKIDPVDLRIKLLSGSLRLRHVVEEAANRSGWGRGSATGRALGIAAYSCFGSHVAHVAEVGIGSGGEIRVSRVVCVVDCGMVVNPDTIVAQMESAVAFALSAALKGKITIDGGRVQQSNFDDFPILRIDEMPRVEVHILPSMEAPGGIGEPGVPPLAPAVANAIYRATGIRVRTIPVGSVREQQSPAV